MASITALYQQIINAANIALLDLLRKPVLLESLCVCIWSSN
jgi:hypothetical protein